MSHLNASYVSQTPAVAPAGSPAAAAPAADSPLGFLGALLEQLLAAGTDAIRAGATGEANPAVDVPGLLGAAVGASTDVPANKPALPADLLAALTARLDQLQARAESGDAASPVELPNLGHAVDALIRALAQPATSTGADPVGEISAEAGVSTTVTPAIPLAQITKLLRDLDLIEAPQTKLGDPRKALKANAEVAPAPDLTALLDRLKALSQSVAATNPDLAQKLNTLITRLEPAAIDPAVAAQLGLAPPQPDADVATIAHIIRALLGNGEKPEPPPPTAHTADAGVQPANPASQVQDDLLQIVASLGLNTSGPAASTPASEGVHATASVPQPLLRLSTQLSQVAAELATSAPELGRKLEAVAARLISADASASLNGKITSAAAQSDGTALEKLVRSLIDARPVTAPALTVAAPQIAAPSPATLPAPSTPVRSKAAVVEVKAAPPEPAAVTADSTPRPAQNVTVAAAAQEPAGDTRPDAKAEAGATPGFADAGKTSATDQQPPQAQASQVASAPTVQQLRPLPAAYQPVANPINMGQVAFEMMRQVHQGGSRFTIRLDPPELGRVDVKLHVDNTGTVNARLTVDRAETLDLFQRDRQSLERALSQAGLDSSRTNLEFSLRQQHHNPFAGLLGGDQRQPNSGSGGAARFGLADNDEAATAPSVTLYRGAASAGGVNILA